MIVQQNQTGRLKASRDDAGSAGDGNNDKEETESKVTAKESILGTLPQTAQKSSQHRKLITSRIKSRYTPQAAI